MVVSSRIVRQLRSALAALVAGAALCAPALAQFDVPASTSVRERITGNLLSAEGAPNPEPGDQIGAFTGDQIAGLFTFSSDSAREFSVVIYGDVASTTGVVEGAKRNEAVTFRFYDLSANTARTDVVVETTNGERFNYRYAGEEVPPLDDLPIPIDLTPTRNLNLRVGVTGNGGGGGGGDDEPVNDFDVDGNGKVEVKDAALVLRIVTGATRGLSDEVIGRADVDGDQNVTTSDAIAILQFR